MRCLVSMELMMPSGPRRETIPSTSLFSQMRPLACCTRSSFSRSAYISQYGWGTNDWISFSRSTMRARVGDCTLPTERNSLPSRPEVRDIYLVRAAPQTRSMICLASPDAARS